MSAKGPAWWANRASTLLRHAHGEARFPVDVETLAIEWSKVLEPAAPITKVQGRELEGFEGALVDGRARGKGWGIVYSEPVRSPGRRRFTIAHEFGHFVLHRHASPTGGFRCAQEDLATWDHDRDPREAEANRFAAGVLMPLDDFRAQMPARSAANLETLGGLAERYGVSLTACALRWLEYTERRALLVVSRDGFILWAKPSSPALRSGRFFRTRGAPPMELPEASPILRSKSTQSLSAPVEHPPGVWFDEPVREEVIVSDRYDLGLSLLIFADASASVSLEEETELDVVDLIARPTEGIG